MYVYISGIQNDETSITVKMSTIDSKDTGYRKFDFQQTCFRFQTLSPT